MVNPNEIKFLEGPQSRWREFKFAWKVLLEFIKGYRSLAFVGPCVTIFGSARFNEGHEYYELTRKVGAEVAKMGFTVMTGGGPGLMEAANRGAKEVGGRSVGCNIVLPHEQAPNQYVTPELSFNFHYFAIRKMHFLMRAQAICIFPGGFGTLDELFETLTLIQTQKAARVPVILYDKAFWQKLINFDMLVEEGLISPEDLDLIQYANTPEHAWQLIQEYYQLSA